MKPRQLLSTCTFREIANVAQEPGPARRRWFRCDDMDLFTWQEADGTVVRFQLTARSRERELACTWDPGEGLVPGAVDDGSSEAMKHPGAPLIVRGSVVDTGDLAARFAARSDALDATIRAHVMACLLATAAPASPASPAPEVTKLQEPPPLGPALLVLLFVLLTLLLGLLQRGAH